MKRIVQVISGGQTGADIAGLHAARACNVKTGGTAPYGYMTENGPSMTLKTIFGLKESRSSNYTARTISNVRNSDITLWFGHKNSAGYYCTQNACTRHGKPFVSVIKLNPSEMYLETTRIRSITHTLPNKDIIINVAGNRESLNSEIGIFTFNFMQELLKICK